jgi:DNA-directed RNA polymerase subunit RPC12/RpoP
VRCSSCSADTPGKTLKGLDYRCPNCGHQFVAIKRRDGVSDAAIRKAIEQVSDKGKLYYRSEHLAYRLQRKLVGAGKTGRVGCLVVAAFVVAFLLLIAATARAWWPLIPIAVLSLGAAIVWFGSTSKDLFELVKRFEAVNPPERGVPATEALIERERGREALLAGLRGAGRILVCQNRHDAHFLIANDFHLQHACPVTGPDGKAVDGFPELEQRLARPGALDVFVLHDLTPAGFGFMRRVRQLSGVVRRRDPATLIKMGFDDRHLPLLKRSLLPLSRIPGSSDATVNTWKGGEGAQVTALLPAVLLAAAGTSIADRAPIRVPLKERDDGLEDSETGDSE